MNWIAIVYVALAPSTALYMGIYSGNTYTSQQMADVSLGKFKTPDECISSVVSFIKNNPAMASKGFCKSDDIGKDAK